MGRLNGQISTPILRPALQLISAVREREARRRYPLRPAMDEVVPPTATTIPHSHVSSLPPPHHTSPFRGPSTHHRRPTAKARRHPQSPDRAPWLSIYGFRCHGPSTPGAVRRR
jgi:hypothetical protein